MITTIEAAQFIGVSAQTVVRSAKRHDIGTKKSGRFLFTREEIERLKDLTPIRGPGCPLFSDPDFIEKNRKKPRKKRI